MFPYPLGVLCHVKRPRPFSTHDSGEDPDSPVLCLTTGPGTLSFGPHVLDTGNHLPESVGYHRVVHLRPLTYEVGVKGRGRGGDDKLGLVLGLSFVRSN